MVLKLSSRDKWRCRISQDRKNCGTKGFRTHSCHQFSYSPRAWFVSVTPELGESVFGHIHTLESHGVVEKRDAVAQLGQVVLVNHVVIEKFDHPSFPDVLVEQRTLHLQIVEVDAELVSAEALEASLKAHLAASTWGKF
ncbi:hypothetical protein IAT38_004794 [Cryptococcus sp. DSM 104549]